MARYRAFDLAVELKIDLTPVTEADRAVEEALRARIARERGEAVAGEEDGVAEGRIEAGSDTVMNEWDIAAPRLIVEEAGGRFTVDKSLYLFSNGLLHEEIRELLLSRP